MNEDGAKADHCRKRVIQRGGRWQLANDGLRELELLAYSPSKFQ